MSQLAKQTVLCDWYEQEPTRLVFLERLRKCDVIKSLIDLVPAYAAAIPDTKPIPDGLASAASCKVLYPAIAEVLRTTRQFLSQPIALFFDDVQWIDPGTKDVLSYLIDEDVPVLIIVAFRDQSTQNTFTINSMLQSQSLELRDPIGLSLHEFTEKDVTSFIDQIPLPEDQKHVLSRFLYEQTGGNQFYIRFRLSMMAETGALKYSDTQRCWILDKGLFGVGVQVNREDVVEYCIQVLNTLEKDVIGILSRIAMTPQGKTISEYASIFRNEKGVLAVSASNGCSVEEAINNAAKVAVMKGILFHNKSGFSFSHDRLQQCAVQCLSSNEVSEIRFYLGIQGLEVVDSEMERSFDVLQNFFEARELVTDPELILRIGKLAAQASSLYITAGSLAAFDRILDFVRELLETLRDENSDVSTLEVRLLVSHHQIKYLMNDVDAAESLFRLVQSHLKTATDIRDAYFSRITLLANTDSNLAAIETCANCLEKLGDFSLPTGLVLPDGEPAAIVQKVKQMIQAMYAKNPSCDAEGIAGLLPASSDEDHNFQVEILISCIGSAYVIGRFDLYMYIPAVAVLKILEKGITRSSGHAFSVLGFALCAVFGDNFGAEVAMLGNYVVERFAYPIAVCRSLCLTGISVVYDERYEHLASKHLYRSYAAGRTAHDLLWACYSVFILLTMLFFEGIRLSEIVETLEDLYAYALSDGHQLLAQHGCKIALHTAMILIEGKPLESPVFHFSLPADEASAGIPLLVFAHGATSVICLYFEHKLQVAWKLITELVDQKLEDASPGLPPKYFFNTYAVVVAHAVLVEAATGEDGEDSTPLNEATRKRLIEVMRACSATLKKLNEMAPFFTPFARIAEACLMDVVDDKPLEALKLFDSVSRYALEEKKGKHFDLVALSQLESARICRKLQLPSMQHSYTREAKLTLEAWDARHAASLYGKDADGIFSVADGEDAGSSSGVTSSEKQSNSTPTVHINFSSEHKSTATMSSSMKRRYDALDFEAILASASHISSAHTFDDLCEKLSTTLLKHSTATRLLLLMRQGESGDLTPVAECTSKGLISSPRDLNRAKHSQSIVRISDKLKDSVVVAAAQDESPYCFESYVQESGVQSISSLPIIYQNSVIAIVYVEHKYLKGAFTTEIMATLTLLGQHVASAIVNARLLRDVRVRSAQLEQSHAFLAKAVRVKDTILSNTSHEFRSPLNGIIGLNEGVLSSDVELHPEVQHCAETTLKMSKQLLALVGDILDMSKLDESSLVLNYELCYLRPIVEEIFAVSKATNASVTLENNVPDGFEILADPLRLKQILLNVISNGVKFSPDGKVEVTAELCEDEKVFTITIQDNGIGIAPAQLDVSGRCLNFFMFVFAY